MPSVVEFDCPYYSQQEKKVLFVTNNATKSRKNYKRKFDQLGVEAHVVNIYDLDTVEPQSNTNFKSKDEIYGSAYAAAVYISSVVKLPKDKKVYVIGMAGMEEELRDEGVSFIGGMVGTHSRLAETYPLTVSQDPADRTFEPFSLSDFILDPDVAAVVCGLDMNVNYTKLSKAFQYLIRNPNCLFLATNDDSTYPSAGGLLPGAGAISAPLRCALGKDPLSIGKPASTMLDCIKAKSVTCILRGFLPPLIVPSELTLILNVQSWLVIV